MAYFHSNTSKSPSVLEQLLEEINFQRTKEMRQLLKDDSGFVMLQGTTYWTDLFVRHFLFQNEATIDCDDLLFFVRKKHVKGSPRYLPKFETEVDVFRKDSRKLPIGDPDIDWEETVYLNLIIHQFEYTLTLAICTRTSPKELQVLKRHSQKVYASPSRRRMDTKGEVEEMTYPHICFMVDNFDEVFHDILVRDGEMVCVELVAADRSGAVQGVIFLGSIRYDALKKVYDARQSSLGTKMAQRMTFGLFSNANSQRCEFVRMKGPQGKGHAEMAVTKPKGSGVETPTSEPGFCATDMWDSDWEDDPEDFFVYRNQRRLSDPSANLNNFVRGSWKSKVDSKSRSEQEGLDTINNGVSEIEAGDLRDDKSGPTSSTKPACCGCFLRKKRDSLVLLEMYRTACQEPSRCSARAPLGPPEYNCTCESVPQITKLINQSEYEVGKEKYLKIRRKAKKPQQKSTKEFEFADDAISLNNETFDDDPPVINKALTENPYLNVNGKVEVPLTTLNERFYPKESSLKTNNVTSIDKDDATNSNARTEHIQDVVNRLKDDKNLDKNENKLVLKKIYSYCTLPKNKKVSTDTVPKAVYRPSVPPKRVTPDGTHIYYWCDIHKRGPSELDDGAYNPLWTMRGFTQTFHFWKENKRAQSVPLNAFLTYVTLPWWSIAKDLLDHREGPILTF
ncbi:uncharacterized protein LOC123684181 isoform X1 [Harmonia axyridis]|uniref:uncharacterized protein LOC123684181 isoform X1 n=2 Tax=Harmonia axyridis TaxID=115357 RepID=UPI001E276499|nr:uncharacterized protein LOC123684181 isoform X1 [Harmonia axyridis]